MDRIAIVDDVSVEREQLIAIISSLGFECVGFMSVEKAIKAMESENFLAFVVDDVMPGLSGFSMCKMINQKIKTQACPDIPIVMAGSRIQVSDQRFAMISGAKAWLPKPATKKSMNAAFRKVPQLLALLERISMEAVIQQETPHCESLRI